MKKILLTTIFAFNVCAYSQTLNTQLRDDAGAPTNQSGFYQTQNPVNYPPSATSFWHLLDVRHTNASDNNYGMQFAGSFFDQELWFRKTNTDTWSTATTANKGWSKIVMQNPSGNVGIGVSSPSARLDVLETIALSAVNYDANRRIDRKWIFAALGGGTEMFLAPRRSDDSDWDWPKQIVFNNGNIAASGRLEAKEVKVTQSPTADFVFEDNYYLPNLEEVEKHIKEKKHLPEIASAKEMEKEGVNIGEFQIKLLQKIEELTLYSIEQNKQIKELKKENENLKQESLQIKTLLKRVEKLEKKENAK